MPEQPQLSSSPTSIPSNAFETEPAVLDGHMQVHQPERVRLRDHLDRVAHVHVVLGRDRPDLLRRELARKRAQFLLFVGEGERDAARDCLLDRGHPIAPCRSTGPFD